MYILTQAKKRRREMFKDLLSEVLALRARSGSSFAVRGVPAVLDIRSRMAK